MCGQESLWTNWKTKLIVDPQIREALSSVSRPAGPVAIRDLHGALPFRRPRKCWLYFRFFAKHVLCGNPYSAVFIVRSGRSVDRAPKCISTLDPEMAEACPGVRC